MSGTLNPTLNCSNCKKNWNPDNTDIKPSGIHCKTCKICREKDKKRRNKNKVIHTNNPNGTNNITDTNNPNDINNTNNPNGTNNITDTNNPNDTNKTNSPNKTNDINNITDTNNHNNTNDTNTTVKIIKGNKTICEHHTIKRQCKLCKGGAFCEHNRRKAECRDCKGSQICTHNKIKSSCKDCGGVQICLHNKRRTVCKDCKGGSLCIHNKRKSECRDCKGNSFCEHNRRKAECRECKGSQICIHNKNTRNCKVCNLPLYLVNIQRKNIKRCIKLSTLSKTKHSIEYLGCDIEYFIQFFKKKMDNFNLYSEVQISWDNIHIDHIKPVNVFNLNDEEEFLACCHYTNLQPLIAVDNLEKSNKWNTKANEHWLKNIKNNAVYSDIYIPT